MIYFSKQVKFKKQSESLGLNLNDKHIKNSKRNLMLLVQKHQEVDQTLKRKKQQFIVQKKRIIQQHRFLTEQQKKHKIRLFKLQVRRDQLTAKENKMIYHQKANILKKYLKCMTYTMGDKFRIIQLMKSEQSYERKKTAVIHFEFLRYFRNKKKEIVYLKKVEFQDELMMVCIKQKRKIIDQKCKTTESQISSFKSKTSKSIFNPSSFMLKQDAGGKSFQVSVQAITGKFFQIKKQYSQNELKKYVNKLPNKPATQCIPKKLSFLQNLNKKHRPSLQFNPIIANGLKNFLAKERNSIQTQGKMQYNVSDLQKLKLSFKTNKIQQVTNQSKQSQQISRIVQSDCQQTNRSQVQQTKMSKFQEYDLNFEQKNEQEQNYNQNENQGLHTLSSLISESKIDPQERSSAYIQDRNTLSPTTKKQSDPQYFSNKQNKQKYSGFLKSFLDGNEVYLLPNKNPILNLVILKKKNLLQLLPQYLSQKGNAARIDLSFRKYKLKLQLQRKVKKILMYKTMKISNFFQTINNVIQPVELQLLFLVKYARDDMYIPKKDEVDSSQKLANLQRKSNKKLKSKTSDIFFISNSKKSAYRLYNKNDIVITCENIKSYSQNFTFLIHQLLKMQEKYQQGFNNISNLNLVNNNRNKFRVKQNKKKDNVKHKESMLKDKPVKDSKKIKQQLQKLAEEQKLKQQKLRLQVVKMFQRFINQHIIKLDQQKFIAKIEFGQHLSSIVRIQKNIKMKFYEGIYKNTAKPKISYKYDKNSHILITAVFYPQTKSLKVYVECVNLMLKHSHRQKPIQYHQKYWSTIQSSIQSINKFSESSVQARDQLQAILKKKIYNYDQQQLKIQLLKPEMYLNRLRRFFINIMLRSKAKKNIWYIKKVHTSFGQCALMIRNSELLNNVFDVNLYYLQELQEKEKQLLSQIDENQQRKSVSSEQSQQKSGLTSKKQQQVRYQKIRYQTISIRKQYLLTIDKAKISEEFYFDINYFLMKPLKSPQIRFLQRLNCISINSDEISKQMTLIQIQNPLKKKVGTGLNLFRFNSTQSFKQFGFDSLSNTESIKILDQPVFKNKRKSTINMNLASRKQSKLLGRISKVQSIANSSSNKLSMHRISKNSIIDIFNRQKIEYQLKNNVSKQILYFSLLKCEQVFYYLDLYIVHRTYSKKNATKADLEIKRENLSCLTENQYKLAEDKQKYVFNDELVLIGRESLNKKELMEANWSFIYQKIAQWLKQHQYMLEIINPLQEVENC